MYQACVFDMDGTILNTIDSIAFFANRALAELGLPSIETDAYRKLVGDGAYTLTERMLETVGAEVTEAAKSQLFKVYSRFYADDPLYLVSPYEGIGELLHALHEKGIKLAVLSNKPHEMTAYMAEKYFPNLFTHVQGQVDGVPVKPDPMSLLSILSSLHADKQDTLYCGDSDVDMQTAKNAGVDSAGVLWGFRSREELIANGAVYTARTAADLHVIIEGGAAADAMRAI